MVVDRSYLTMACPAKAVTGADWFYVAGFVKAGCENLREVCRMKKPFAYEIVSLASHGIPYVLQCLVRKAYEPSWPASRGGPEIPVQIISLTGIRVGLAETWLRGSEVKSGLVCFGPNAHFMINLTFTLPIPYDES